MISSVLFASPTADHARLDMIDTLLAQEPMAACSCEATRTDGTDEDEECAYVYRCTNGASGETTSSCDVERATTDITDRMCDAGM
jgi:hypothetical protein